jgi:hypothetical protein
MKKKTVVRTDKKPAKIFTIAQKEYPKAATIPALENTLRKWSDHTKLREFETLLNGGLGLRDVNIYVAPTIFPWDTFEKASQQTVQVYQLFGEAVKPYYIEFRWQDAQINLILRVPLSGMQPLGKFLRVGKFTRTYLAVQNRIELHLSAEKAQIESARKSEKIHLDNQTKFNAALASLKKKAVAK